MLCYTFCPFFLLYFCRFEFSFFFRESGSCWEKCTWMICVLRQAYLLLPALLANMQHAYLKISSTSVLHLLIYHVDFYRILKRLINVYINVLCEILLILSHAFTLMYILHFYGRLRNDIKLYGVYSCSISCNLHQMFPSSLHDLWWFLICQPGQGKNTYTGR